MSSLYKRSRSKTSDLRDYQKEILERVQQRTAEALSKIEDPAPGIVRYEARNLPPRHIEHLVESLKEDPLPAALEEIKKANREAPLFDDLEETFAEVEHRLPKRYISALRASYASLR